MDESVATTEENITSLALLQEPEVLPSESIESPSPLKRRLDYVFSSPGTLYRELLKVGYITDVPTAFTVWLAYKLNRPIIQEGPAGAGKTQLAVSVAEVTGQKVVRLQCYPGITDDKAIGRYNEELQRIFSSIMHNSNATIEEINQKICSREFFIVGPLLQAIEANEPCVLLIDEVDKVPHEFEAMLLEVLSVWELSAPGLGTIKATTKPKPLTFITSNAERDLADPLRRRSLYIEVKHPTPELESKIVAYKTRSLPTETHVFIAGMALALRAYVMKKPPSISEMSDIASAMELMGLTTIRPEHQEIFLPMFAKRAEDIKKLRGRGAFADIVSQANHFLLQVKIKIAVSIASGIVPAEILEAPIDKIVDKLMEYEDTRKIVESIEFSSFPDREIKQIAAEYKALEESKKG
jgi:MoxR-like ATPase